MRNTITIDGTEFDAESTNVVFTTLMEAKGMPNLSTFGSTIRVLVNMHDDTNLGFDKLKKLFDLANLPTREKIKDMQVDFWTDDDKTKRLASYKFQGWICRFETSNPLPTNGTHSRFNQLLVMDL